MKKLLTCLGLCVLLLAACEQSHTDKTAGKQISYEVKPQALQSVMYFSTTIEPLSMVNVSSPEDGVVIEKHFTYGEKITKGQLLVTIDSDKLEKEYNTALSTFLSAKDKLATSKANFEGSKELYELGIISRNTFEQDKSAYNSANVAFLQAILNLKQTIKKGGQGHEQALEKLSIADIDAVSKALKIKYNFLNLIADTGGVALMPPKSTGSDDGKIEVGSEVKLGQVLVVIGDLSGATVKIQIAETNIDIIKAGMQVTLSSAAFPKQVLKGEIKTVASQASTTTGFAGGVPTFPATIIVSQLTAAQQQVIRVGMSAKVKLVIKRQNVLLVPIAAVQRKGPLSLLTVKRKGKTLTLPVTTGETNLSQVEITSGLRSGDVVLYSQASKQQTSMP